MLKSFLKILGMILFVPFVIGVVNIGKGIFMAGMYAEKTVQTVETKEMQSELASSKKEIERLKNEVAAQKGLLSDYQGKEKRSVARITTLEISNNALEAQLDTFQTAYGREVEKTEFLTRDNEHKSAQIGMLHQTIGIQTWMVNNKTREASAYRPKAVRTEQAELNSKRLIVLLPVMLLLGLALGRYFRPIKPGRAKATATIVSFRNSRASLGFPKLISARINQLAAVQAFHHQIRFADYGAALENMHLTLTLVNEIDRNKRPYSKYNATERSADIEFFLNEEQVRQASDYQLARMMEATLIFATDRLLEFKELKSYRVAALKKDIEQLFAEKHFETNVEVA